MCMCRSLSALIFLMSTSVHAGISPSPESCQKMILSLLENFDSNHSNSKEQIMQFADKCMPESVLSNRLESTNRFQLSEDFSDKSSAQIRM